MKPLNLVVVICHDLGKRLGCYGYDDVRSPNIDSFTATGIRFDGCYCTAPQCSPSRAGLWTGRYPHANGVVGLVHSGFANDLHPEEKHLAQILGEAGYDTHLFGIQHEARSSERCGYQHISPHGSCAELADMFESFIQHRPTANRRPFFAQIGFFEPHRPFPHDDVAPLPHDRINVPGYLPDIPEIREDLADMEASISSADRAFGKIVDSIRDAGLDDETIVVFTADHGIPFPRAKMTLYDPGIEVSLMFSIPGLRYGGVKEHMVSNIDIMPTLLDLLRLEQHSPPGLHGTSFAELLRSEDADDCGARNEIFAEKTYHTYYYPMRAIRTDRWKLIANFEFAPWQETSPDYLNNAKGYVEVSKALNLPYGVQYHPPYELYDLQNDSCEQENLADDPDYESTRNRLITRLRQWMIDTGDPLIDGPISQGAYRERMRDFKNIELS